MKMKAERQHQRDAAEVLHRKSFQGVRVGALCGAGCPSTSDVVARRASVGCVAHAATAASGSALCDVHVLECTRPHWVEAVGF